MGTVDASACPTLFVVEGSPAAADGPTPLGGVRRRRGPRRRAWSDGRDGNQSFRWEQIERVCFTDEGLYSSDRISIELKGGLKPVVVLTEALGGNEFFGALTERGYFPQEVCRRAMGETGGATHCWPPQPSS
jgi:hypothetical protein